MSINKELLSSLLKAYMRIQRLQENIYHMKPGEIKEELEMVEIYHLSEAIFNLFEWYDIDILEKSMDEFIKVDDSADADKFLEYISLYRKRGAKQ